MSEVWNTPEITSPSIGNFIDGIKTHKDVWKNQIRYILSLNKVIGWIVLVEETNNTIKYTMAKNAKMLEPYANKKYMARFLKSLSGKHENIISDIEISYSGQSLWNKITQIMFNIETGEKITANPNLFDDHSQIVLGIIY